MLDNDTLDGGLDVEVLDEAVVEGEPPEEESLEISIEGDEPEAADPDDIDEATEAELGDRARRALQAMRKAAKASWAEAKAAKAELAAIRMAPAVADEPAPERPTIEGCGYNTEIYDQKLRDYFQAEAKAEAVKQERIAEAKAADEDYQARLGKYVSGKTAMKVDDFDAAESVVRSKLTISQQNVLIRLSDDPAKTVLALGRSKKALDDLAAVKDVDRFAKALTLLEAKITVTPKSPPPPESKIRGGTATGGLGSFASQLAAAEKEADRTGDRSKIVAIKRQMKAAGVKA